MARTAGDVAGAVVIGLLAVAVTLQPLGCDDGPAASPAVGAAVAAVGPEVVAPNLTRFRDAAAALSDAAHAWADADADGAPAARESARDAWAAAMAVWQELEVQQIGPAASSLTATGGADLREAIYSWPVTNPCRVDQETVVGAFDAADWFETHLPNTYGLDALEHLLFSGPDNVCAAQIPPNSDGAWAALDAQALDQRRADYAALVADGVLAQADALVTAWDPAGGDFGGRLARAGDGDPYPSDQEALQAIFDALFYIEAMTRDAKLAIPLGLAECATERCPEAAESPSSGASTDWIAANLLGFRDLFTGGAGAGLDDLLVDVGQAAIADEVLADVDAAIAIAESLDVSVQEGVVSRPDDLLALHDAIRAVTDDLETDVAAALVLQIPAEASGDND
jgi:predicted lipoprotein